MRLRNSIRRQPWSWIGSAMVAGVMAGFFRQARSSNTNANEKKLIVSKKHSSLIQNLGTIPSFLLGETTLALAAGKFFRFLFPLLRPIITEYLTRQFRSHEKEL